LQVVLRNTLWRLLLPDWVLGLYKKGREIRESFKELGVYMQEMIQSRKQALFEQGPEPSDLFSSLLRASVTEDQGSMTDQELMGELWTVSPGPTLTHGCRKHCRQRIFISREIEE
jgi:cytochrome P450